MKMHRPDYDHRHEDEIVAALEALAGLVAAGDRLAAEVGLAFMASDARRNLRLDPSGPAPADGCEGALVRWKLARDAVAVGLALEVLGWTLGPIQRRRSARRSIMENPL